LGTVVLLFWIALLVAHLISIFEATIGIRD
jgi:hypothetical protein